MDREQGVSGFGNPGEWNSPHPVGGSERVRLEAIERMRAARPAANGALQEILDTTRGVFGVESCAVNLLLSGVIYVRAWSGKIPEGLAATRRELWERSLCPRVVVSGEPLLVGDLLESEELSEHYARAVLGLRFYAGVPLITSEGRAIGTLCLLDPHPREFEQDGMLNLKSSARAITRRLEFLGDLHREREAREREESATIERRPNQRPGSVWNRDSDSGRAGG